MLVAVSATEEIRDELRRLILTLSTANREVYFLELEFQPSEERRLFQRL